MTWLWHFLFDVSKVQVLGSVVAGLWPSLKQKESSKWNIYYCSKDGFLLILNLSTYEVFFLKRLINLGDAVTYRFGILLFKSNGWIVTLFILKTKNKKML